MTFALAFTIVMVLGWAAVWIPVVYVGLVIPPPPPLRTQSALLNRLSQLVKGTWAGAVFATSAIYGALVGLDVSHAQTSPSALDHLAWHEAAPIIELVATLCALGAGCGCAIDIKRTPAAVREHHVQRFGTWLRSRPWGKELPDVPWLARYLSWCCRGCKPVVASWLAPAAFAASYLVIAALWSR